MFGPVRALRGAAIALGGEPAPELLPICDWDMFRGENPLLMVLRVLCVPTHAAAALN